MKKEVLGSLLPGNSTLAQKRLDLPQRIQKISSTLWQIGELISGCKNEAGRIPLCLRHSWADARRTAVSNDLSSQGACPALPQTKCPIKISQWQ
jgi:hypothetical protein